MCSVCVRDVTWCDRAEGQAVLVGFGVLLWQGQFLLLMPMRPLGQVRMVIAFIALCAAVIGLCLWLLPVAKGVLLNLQLHQGAEQASFKSEDQN